MSDKPIWFLDVDGVVNALPKHGNASEGYQQTTILGFPIKYRPEVIEFINRIHRDGLAEVHWLTTWGADARYHFAKAVGLDDFEHAHEPAQSGSQERIVWLPTWWKLQVIKSVAQGRRFVFTDDDLGADITRLIRDFANDTLLLTPCSEVGLDDEQLEHIDKFLRA